jgi:hypothetical protein
LSITARSSRESPCSSAASQPRRYDAGDAHLGGRFLAREQNFLEALARTDAGEHDVDVLARL